MDWDVLLFGVIAGYAGTEWIRNGNVSDAIVMAIALTGGIIHLF